MNEPGEMASLQSALDFIMLKTHLQRLGMAAGGYGLLACIYGLPKNHQNLYLVHLSLGVLLLIASIMAVLFPKPRHSIILGALLAVMGLWINIMSHLGEAAGGSVKGFAIWGIVLFLGGMIAIFDYERFSYLNTYLLCKQEIDNAGMLVKRLLSANPKKQLDVITVRINLEPESLNDISYGEMLSIVRRCSGRWKARLLPDAMILVRGSAARALVLNRDNFTIPEAPMHNGSGVGYSVSISGRSYKLLINRKQSERLNDWLVNENRIPSA